MQEMEMEVQPEWWRGRGNEERGWVKCTQEVEREKKLEMPMAGRRDEMRLVAFSLLPAYASSASDLHLSLWEGADQ